MAFDCHNGICGMSGSATLSWSLWLLSLLLLLLLLLLLFLLLLFDHLDVTHLQEVLQAPVHVATVPATGAKPGKRLHLRSRCCEHGCCCNALQQRGTQKAYRPQLAQEVDLGVPIEPAGARRGQTSRNGGAIAQTLMLASDAHARHCSEQNLLHPCASMRYT